MQNPNFIPPKPTIDPNADKKGAEPPKKDNTRIVKYLFFLFSIVVAVSVGIFLLLPKYDTYTLAKEEIKVSKEDIKDFKKEEIELNLKLKGLIDEKEEENKETLQLIEDLLPIKENLTDIVRMFDTFSYDLHSTGNPIVIKSISFGKEESAKGYKMIPIKIDLTCSKVNFERFLYFIETSGILEASELIDENKLKTLEEMMTPEESNKLKELLNKDYDREDLVKLKNRLKLNEAEERLMNDLLSKVLFYKEVVVEKQYFPTQAMTLDSFNIKIEQNPEKANLEGEISINAVVKVYFKTKQKAKKSKK